MPFSATRYTQLQNQILQTLESSQINDWDRSFLQHMQGKLDRFGTGTRFTDKQYHRLMALTHDAKVIDLRTSALRGRQDRSVHVGPQHRMKSDRRHQRAWVKLVRWTFVLLIIPGFIGYKAVERFPEKLGSLVALTSVAQVSGSVTRVRDGDTIEVAGVPIRFGSLDCAERDTSEGRLATGRIRELISGQTLQCFLNGRTSYDRKIGSCRLSNGRDLASVMIEEGYCSRYW